MNTTPDPTSTSTSTSTSVASSATPALLDASFLRAIVTECPIPFAVIRGGHLLDANRAFQALVAGDQAGGRERAAAPTQAPGAPWELLPPPSSSGAGAPTEGELVRLLCGADSADTARASGARLRRRTDGRCYVLRAAPLPDQQAVSVWLIETAAETATATAWIEQHERLRVTGELALGIAHDVHNTLGAIALRVSVLKKNAPAMAAQGKNIEALERIVGEGNALVGKFQRLGQAPPRSEPQAADLREVIATAVEIAQSGLRMRAAETGVSIRMEMVVPALPAVNGTADELCQLFVNLLINARDAMPSGGRVVITAEPDPGASEVVVVRVEDEGTGVPPAVKSRMFDSFFTTKGRSGTGMGLAMARATMTRVGGSIDVADRPAGGAVFTLRFPRDPAPRA